MEVEQIIGEEERNRPLGTYNVKISEIFKSSSAVTVVRSQPSHSLIICATQEGSVIGLDSSRDFRQKLIMATGLATIEGLDVHPTEMVTAVAGKGRFQIWDISNQNLLFQEQFSNTGLGFGFCLRFHPRSSWVLFAGYMSSFVACDWKSQKTEKLFEGADFNVWIDFHPNGELGAGSVLFPQWESRIGFFTFQESGKCEVYTKPIIQKDSDVPMRMIFSPDGTKLVVSYTNLNFMQLSEDIQVRGAVLGFLALYELSTCKLLYECPVLGTPNDLHAYGDYGPKGETLYGPKGFLTNVITLSHGRYAACGTQNGTIALLDISAGKIKQYLPVHGGNIHSIDKLDEVTLVSGGADGTVRLIDLSEDIEQGQSVTSNTTVFQELLAKASKKKRVPWG